MSADYPLSGIRVLDVSRVLAGPYVGRMLCDLGADVVKIEPPEGDVTRNWGRVIGGLSGYYTQQNVGKRNVSVDLRKPAAPELLQRMAARADVLVENFRPGVMAQFGLAYADVSPSNPRLIMLSITGYGQRGPEAGKPAYAAVRGRGARRERLDASPRHDVSFHAARRAGVDRRHELGSARAHRCARRALSA